MFDVRCSEGGETGRLLDGGGHGAGEAQVGLAQGVIFVPGAALGQLQALAHAVETAVGGVGGGEGGVEGGEVVGEGGGEVGSFQVTTVVFGGIEGRLRFRDGLLGSLDFPLQLLSPTEPAQAFVEAGEFVLQVVESWPQISTLLLQGLALGGLQHFQVVGVASGFFEPLTEFPVTLEGGLAEAGVEFGTGEPFRATHCVPARRTGGSGRSDPGR